MTLTTRPMTSADVPSCVEIVNHIIALGGTTAYEQPFTKEDFDAQYCEEPPISIVVLSRSRIVGFQALFEVAPGLYSIGCFTDQQNPMKGAGRGMFKATLAAAKLRGGSAILAKITSDNTGGLAYYNRMGFVDFDVKPSDMTRPDGTVVDRIIKRLEL